MPDRIQVVTDTPSDGNYELFDVYYSAENRQKRIQWVSGGTGNGVAHTRQLYSELQDHFDELTQLDDGVPMSAQTPTEFTIGIIDSGDKDPWFIDRSTVEHLKGGALKTTSWDRVEGTNTGIVRVVYTDTTNLDASDIGRSITSDEGDNGTILDFNDIGATQYMWIRPLTNAAGDSFDFASEPSVFTIDNASFNQIVRWDNSGAAFASDETTDANDVGDNDWDIFATGADSDDYVAIGFRQKFGKVIFDNANGTAGTVGTVTWEYWDGNSWEALAGVSDGTSGFTAATSDGQTLTFTIPTDWAVTSLNGSSQLFYIRALVGTGFTIDPIYDQGFIGAIGAGSFTVDAETGESLWSNVYSIGTILDTSNTHIYVYQSGSYLTSYKSTDSSDWWGDGHVDILVNVKEVDTESDSGYINVYVRRYSQTYSYYTVDLSDGGRNPLPLQTGNDLDNAIGYARLTVPSSANFDVGNYFYRDTGGLTWADTNKKAVITEVPDGTHIVYYLIGEPLLDFTGGDDIQEYTGTGDGDGSTTVTSTEAWGPADLATPPTIRHGADATRLSGDDGGDFDIDEDGTFENYSIVIDCNQNILGSTPTVTGVYEWTKYITRFGGTTLLDTEGIQGEQYIGSDMRVTHSVEESGDFTEGNTVTGGTSGATALVVYHNVTNNILIMRRTRGTFQNGESLTDGTETIASGTTFSAITPIAAAPFGTFAGGTWFLAPGVVLDDYDTGDANNFQLTDDEGNVVVAPTKITLLVRNTRESDRVAVFRLDGSGDIEKDNYNIDATQGAAPSTSIVVTGVLDQDEPGKTAGGVIRVVDELGQFEDRYRFTSWTSGTPSTFTLFNTALLTTDTDSTQTSLNDDSADFSLVKIGDIVYNIDDDEYAYVTAIDDTGPDKSLTTTNLGSDKPVTSWAPGGVGVQYRVGVTVRNYTISDTAYLPLIDTYETSGTDVAPGDESVIVTQFGDFTVRVVARHAGVPGDEGIIPYTADDVDVDGTNGGGMSNTIIRTDDNIFQVL